jgi:hypothetical protein
VSSETTKEAMMHKFAKCPRCGHHVTLNDDNTFRRHSRDPWPGGRKCGESGKVAAEPQEPRS